MFDQYILDRNFRKARERLATEDSLPLQIGSGVSAKIYNNFIERQEAPGYKFELARDGKLFKVDMALEVHEEVVMRLSHFFHQANGVHYNPTSRKMKKIAPDLSIRPNKVHVQAPPTFTMRPVTRPD
ncbi:7258_t:CDS:2 [Paraglomus brasilianum]|uniref:7258_t:CDS:1 n=1 Tax=Paraglomus brasilianum TaxID=144538 RepID=A0A9N8W1K8_9GLOM|nr:7258_t:CDS:2 [Paraglomus brasilianum]